VNSVGEFLKAGVVIRLEHLALDNREVNFSMPDIPRPETISTRQQMIATRAQQAPELSFTSLHHHIDLIWLHEAYRRTRKDGAPGVDGQTAAAYAEHLEDNLRDLLDRAKSGRYRAPAVIHRGE
jgi:RNA-directed DNA polymerase